MNASSFGGGPVREGRGDGRVAAVAAAVLVGFVVLAIAKPWSSPGPMPSTSPSVDAFAPPAPAIHTQAPADRTAAPTPDATSPSPPVHVSSSPDFPLPVAFSAPLGPPPGATWTGIRWRLLAYDDPLGLVRMVRRWSGGFVAVGLDARLPATPVWTSADGRRWVPLVFGTPTTFWRGLGVLAVSALPGGLVAITETLQYCGSPCPLHYVAPVMSWTSSDGRRWRLAHVLPPEWLAAPLGSPPRVVVGPGGIVVASAGPPVHIASSRDGVTWHLASADALPAWFALDELAPTASGFVAVGHVAAGGDGEEPAVFWSRDGIRWSIPSWTPLSGDARSGSGPVEVGLASGRAATIAVASGRSRPTVWWLSADGRRWRPLDGFGPLAVGEGGCFGGECGPVPEGLLVGDGDRLVAIGGARAVEAWASTDGRAWRHLAMTGDVPFDVPSASLVPGGLLVTDGTLTWFGEATAAPR